MSNVNSDSPKSKHLRDLVPLPWDTLIPNVLVAYGWYFLFHKMSPKLAIIVPAAAMALVLLFLLVDIVASEEKAKSLLGSTVVMALFVPLCLIMLLNT